MWAGCDLRMRPGGCSSKFSERLCNQETSQHFEKHSTSGQRDEIQNAYGKTIAKEADPRTAKNRQRESSSHSGSAHSRTLPEGRSDRNLEPGQRRGHAALPGRQRLAE